MEKAYSKTILYVRIPGLLALSTHPISTDTTTHCPIIITKGRLVRDACALALAQGIKVGLSAVQARRLCPSLLTVPLEEVDAGHLRRRFLDILTDLSPVIEPNDPDAAYVDITGCPSVTEQIFKRLLDVSGMPPVMGQGISRLAARACAESGAQRLEDAAVEWLWPDDPAVIGRLRRLGLDTFGAVAAISANALRQHFGKITPLLRRRAQGVDLTPVRALYPPPCVDVFVPCEEPVGNREQLRQIVARASLRAERQLQGLGVGRLLTLEVETERGNARQEWAVPVPVEKAADIQRAAWRMLTLMRLPAPVTCVHLRIEGVSIPSAHTADLFGVRADAVALEAVRRRLVARFGLTTLKIMGQQPQTAREKRRAARREEAMAFQRTLL